MLVSPLPPRAEQSAWLERASSLARSESGGAVERLYVVGAAALETVPEQLLAGVKATLVKLLGGSVDAPLEPEARRCIQAFRAAAATPGFADPHVAMYAGSFDPVTNGHMELIARAAAAFDTLVVGIGVNPNKRYLLSTDARRRLIEDACAERGVRNVRVVAYEGLTVDEAARQGAGTLVRGVRDTKDLDDELSLAWANHQLAPDQRTVLVLPRRTGGISATRVREALGAGRPYWHLVPPVVTRTLTRLAGA